MPLIDKYQTLGGFLLYHYQRIPAQGETLRYDNLELTIVSAEGPRLNQIRIHRRETTFASNGANGSDVLDDSSDIDAKVAADDTKESEMTNQESGVSRNFE